MLTITGITPSLVAGSVGNIVRVTVTNSTRRGTVLVPYTFILRVQMTIGGQAINIPDRDFSLGAGATGSVDIYFDIPISVSGAGNATATLLTSNGSVIIAGPISKSFTVSPNVSAAFAWVDSPPFSTGYTYVAKVQVTVPAGTTSNTKVDIKLRCGGAQQGYATMWTSAAGVRELTVGVPMPVIAGIYDVVLETYINDVLVSTGIADTVSVEASTSVSSFTIQALNPPAGAVYWRVSAMWGAPPASGISSPITPIGQKTTFSMETPTYFQISASDDPNMLTAIVRYSFNFRPISGTYYFDFAKAQITGTGLIQPKDVGYGWAEAETGFANIQFAGITTEMTNPYTNSVGLYWSYVLGAEGYQYFRPITGNDVKNGTVLSVMVDALYRDWVVKGIFNSGFLYGWFSWPNRGVVEVRSQLFMLHANRTYVWDLTTGQALDTYTGERAV